MLSTSILRSVYLHWIAVRKPHHPEIIHRSHATTRLVRRRIRVLRRGKADLARGRVVHEVVALEPGHAVDELDAGEALQRTDVADNKVDVVRRPADSTVELQPLFSCHSDRTTLG